MHTWQIRSTLFNPPQLSEEQWHKNRFGSMLRGLLISQKQIRYGLHVSP